MRGAEPPIPFLDLRGQLDELRPCIDEAIARVIDSGRFVLGDEVAAFEEEFAAFVGVAYAVGTASGTDALELALLALEIGPGDEVITVSHTFVATALAISATGATPVFVDVQEEDGLIDVAAVAAAITPRTRAILPVHLYGRMVDIEALMALARTRQLRVVEDAAQAHGAELAGRGAGSFGDLGCFSFYPTKNLGALGDGGAVVTDDAELVSRLRLLRNYGETRKYEHVLAGRNSRLDELQAAVLRAKLPLLAGRNERRRGHADAYASGLRDTAVTAPTRTGASDSVHLYAIRSRRRDALRAHLAEAGIGSQIHYPVPVHLQPLFRDVELRHPLPITERLASEVLSLPLYPELTDREIVRVVDAVASFGASERA
jgi:dTDP-4-amino-4,6-dideoxygalactose transaminase